MEKKLRRSYAMNIAAFACFLLALILIILLRLFQIERVVQWYNRYTEALAHFESWMQLNGATWTSVLLIMLNYILKSLVPWVPISCLCVASAVIFKWYFALIINLCGLILLFTIKFFWGRRFGGGNAQKILSKYNSINNFLDSGRAGPSLVLAVLRLVPWVPINAVSRLYGTTDMKYSKFLLLSLAGFSYKLVAYIVIGRNVYDPLSAPFIMPMILMLMITGLALLALNGMFSLNASH